MSTLQSRGIKKHLYTVSSHYSFVARIKQYFIILRILMTEYRTTWPFRVFHGFILPFVFISFVRIARGIPGSEQANFLLGGCMAAAIAYGPISTLINKIGRGKQLNEFHYWTSLPVPKLALILAILTTALLFALPGFIGVYLIGSLILNYPLRGGLILFFLIPLGAFSLAGLGAFLGAYAPNAQAATIIGNFMTIFIGFLSPLYIPLDHLPVLLRNVAPFIPVTYVADAFRIGLAGHVNINLAIDVVILVLFSIGFLGLVHFRLDWRATK